jgi:HNH endonuclease
MRLRGYPALLKLWANTINWGVPETCWEWQASTHRQGYGYVRVASKSVLTHRQMFYEVTDTWPKVVMHKCDNVRCINPEHLAAGSQKENVYDAIAKRRHFTGKLSQTLANQVRCDYTLGGTSHSKLAAKYSVAKSTIGNIIRGKTWKT